MEELEKEPEGNAYNYLQKKCAVLPLYELA